jgi:hypothetical protein
MTTLKLRCCSRSGQSTAILSNGSSCSHTGAHIGPMPSLLRHSQYAAYGSHDISQLANGSTNPPPSQEEESRISGVLSLPRRSPVVGYYLLGTLPTR